MRGRPGIGWAKWLLPRGLYGRSTLILVLPVIVVTLVVSIVFLQRHFEGVTRQMTASMAPEVALIISRIDKAPTLAAGRTDGSDLATPLGMAVEIPVAAEQGDTRAAYDLSGRVVAAEIRARIPQVSAVDLSDPHRVQLVVTTRHGPAEIDFARRRVSASNPHQLLVLMLFSALLSSGTALIFLRNQLRPIRRLARAAEEFGKGRIVPYRIAGATEIRKAGAAFLDMRARIERQIEQRTLLLSGVSHDLRTPLTRLRLGLSMLDTGMAPEREDIAALEHDVEDMGRMVDAFLDFARSEAQDGPARTEAVIPFLREVVEDARRAGQPVRIGNIEGGEDDAAAFRPLALRRAIANLIGNAVRHGTRAEVDVALTARLVRISVEDDGPGIAREDREEVLKPFRRLDPARNQDRGQGVGLGLTIAADIVRAHGGHLHLGEGSRLGGLRAEIVIPR